jgi:hypothetical protein
MSIYSNILWISGAIVAVAVVLYFVGSAKAIRIPAVILGVIGGVGLGALLGMGLSTVYEQESALANPIDPVEIAAEAAKKAGPPAAAKKGGGGGGGMMGGGGRGPSPKNQLIQLITKLDQLTEKPLVVTVSDDQKAKVAEQLKELDSMYALPDDQAKARLDALLAIFEDQRETFEAAGYRWPGGGGRGGPGGGGPGGGGGLGGGEPLNPFATGPNADHLTALNTRMGGSPTPAPGEGKEAPAADEKTLPPQPTPSEGQELKLPTEEGQELKPPPTDPSI